MTEWKLIGTRYTHWGECRHDKFKCATCGFVEEFKDGHTSQWRFCPSCGEEILWNCEVE